MSGQRRERLQVYLFPLWYFCTEITTFMFTLIEVQILKCIKTQGVAQEDSDFKLKKYRLKFTM